MSNATKQAVVTPSGVFDQSQKAETLRLFNPDGSPFSGGGTSKTATITLDSPATILQSAGPNQVQDLLSWYDHASCPFTVSDPDGILDVDLTSDGEVGLVIPGQWFVNTSKGGVNKSGSPDAGYQTSFYSYSNGDFPGTQVYTSNFADASYFGQSDSFYLTKDQVLADQRFGVSIQSFSTSGGFVIALWEVQFTVIN